MKHCDRDVRAAAEQHAIYSRELQAAHYRIQQRTRWVNMAGVAYSMAALVASFMLWGWLPLSPVVWSLSIVTWVGLVSLWLVAQRKLRLVMQQRRQERANAPTQWRMMGMEPK